MQPRCWQLSTLTPDDAIDRDVHPTHTWCAARCSFVQHRLAACSLILVLGSLPVVTAAQSLSPDQGQPRPPGDNRADARSTLLRHDAAARRARGRTARPRTAKGWRKEYEIM
ncbi:hypothetical protein M441DRAFT_440286 [Trichoderma asperellum CBS 433.97]|uniref:Uncharacterized protein n=1 Tax=Trichoderma asperellum (strain ATCC 204424 / CBS 433.97 / NBRC 101777) TaxID=1042311 RepID=A0A2T3Z455_TRIA4|nr:hypothetical protein M441DRAFT_440286 [Trichoderma asperellum CBS 433.97]PTB39575.1 hypothetical protein M441DRAFT_440286 [Trichoderma asperellum CBS 433.97]